MLWKECQVQTVKEERERERETHISNEISARVVVFVENNTVVVVARKLGLRTSKVHVFLEEQSALDVFASMLAERKNIAESIKICAHQRRNAQNNSRSPSWK